MLSTAIIGEVWMEKLGNICQEAPPHFCSFTYRVFYLLHPGHVSIRAFDGVDNSSNFVKEFSQ